MAARFIIMCGNKAISLSELSWLKIGNSSDDSSMQSRQTLSTFITADIITQWRECFDRLRNQISVSAVFYGATVISISDNHTYVCKCSIHFQISANMCSPKHFLFKKSTITKQHGNINFKVHFATFPSTSATAYLMHQHRSDIVPLCSKTL